MEDYLLTIFLNFKINMTEAEWRDSWELSRQLGGSVVSQAKDPERRS